MDCAAYAGTLIDQSFQQTAEGFHNFPLLQLIVLGNHGLEILHQSLHFENQTSQSAFHSKLSFLDIFYIYMVVPNLLNVLPLFHCRGSVFSPNLPNSIMI